MTLKHHRPRCSWCCRMMMMPDKTAGLFCDGFASFALVLSLGGTLYSMRAKPGKLFLPTIVSILHTHTHTLTCASLDSHTAVRANQPSYHTVRACLNGFCGGWIRTFPSTFFKNQSLWWWGAKMSYTCCPRWMPQWSGTNHRLQNTHTHTDRG